MSRKCVQRWNCLLISIGLQSILLQEMNKNEAYTQTKSDPKDLVQSYKERFMVLHLFKSLSSIGNFSTLILLTCFFCRLSFEHWGFSACPHHEKKNWVCYCQDGSPVHAGNISGLEQLCKMTNEILLISTPLVLLKGLFHF